MNRYPVIYTIKCNQTRQRMDGFGICEAFHQADHMMSLPEPQRQQVLDWLFSEEKGIGISILRNIIGDGGEWGDHLDGPTKTIEPLPGVFDFTKDTAQVWLMQEAKKRGCTRFFSSVWSPPAWMKTNQCVHDGGALREENYHDFAEYLAAYVENYKRLFDLDLYAISPANEPATKTNYSSCLWTGEQLHTVIKEHILPVFQKQQLKTKFMLSETERFGNAYADMYDPTLHDEQTAAFVDIVAQHGYGGCIEKLDTPTQKNKPVWMTEICDIRIVPTEEQGNDIKNALYWAKNIHEYITTANVSAYCYFWGASKYCNEGGNLLGIDLETMEYVLHKRFFAIGNYARFIRPGYVRVNTQTDIFDTNIRLSAYKNPTSNEVVVVVINNSDKAQSVTLQLEHNCSTTLTPYRTSATENLERLPAILLQDQCTDIHLLPMSITTFVTKN